jgi:probable selenium-dependent hydroxylase accessory protein YqeC
MKIKPVKIKYLHEALGLKKNETVVVTGAGGKTSFCLELCEELKKNSRIIFTTTTKIFSPKPEEMYKICIGNDFLHKKITENGAYIAGREENKEGKLLPFTLDETDSLKEKGDYLIIEGDGSKMKPLKGWSETEPVFVKRTDKTVGIISIRSLGLKINEENIHRIKIFLEISGAEENETVTKKHLINIINSKNGLFKNAKGEKILLINQADDEILLEEAVNLAELLIKSNFIPDKIIISSLKKKIYYKVPL